MSKEENEKLYRDFIDKHINHDSVQHPSHYCTGKIEVIDYIQDKLGEGYKYYLEGNIIKYISRYRHKNGVEDLKKAEFYLKRLIEVYNE